MSDADFKAAARSCFTRSFGGVIKLLTEDGPVLIVDGKAAGAPNLSLGEADAPADCIWRSSKDTFLRIFDGGRALESAYLSGRLHISGDMSVMNRLVLEARIG